MKARLLRILRWAMFPAFYLVSLGLFGYLTFPYGRLKDRVVAEFEKRGRPGQRLEIGKLSAYWFSGVEVSGVKLHMPSEEPPGMLPHSGSDDAGPKESVIAIDDAHVRVRILPLLLGRVQVDFWASAFGGEISGTAPVGNSKGDIELSIEQVDVSKIDAIVQAVGVPMKGVASGTLSLTAPDGKLAKASGSVDLKVQGAVISDGKTKIQGMFELPPAKLGDLTIKAEAKDGALKITNFTAPGTDLELAGDGKIALRDPWNNALADLYVRFKFTDAYRTKSDITKTLLGEPGSKLSGLIDKAPKMSQAKRTDGFYGWHIHGPLNRLRFDPSSVDVASTTPAVGAPPKRPPREPLGGRRPSLAVGTTEPPPPAPPPRLPLPAATPAPEPAARREAPPPAPTPAPPPPPPAAAPPAPEPPPPAEQPAEQPEAPPPEAQ